MEQLSEKVFLAGAVVEVVVLLVLVVVCVRRRRHAWARAGAAGGALLLLVGAAYLAAVLGAELLGDFRLLQWLTRPWGDVVRAVLAAAGTALLAAAVLAGRATARTD